MRHWFLSFNSSDRCLAEKLKTSIERKDAGSRVFFHATSLRAGGYWQPALAKGIDEADAFVLLVGEKGLGPWQTLEYYEAHDRHVKSPEFPVVLMLLDGHPAPGPAIPAPAALDRKRRPDVRDGRGAAHPCRRRHRGTAGRAVALYIALPRPVGHGGEGRRLFLRPSCAKRWR